MHATAPQVTFYAYVAAQDVKLRTFHIGVPRTAIVATNCAFAKGFDLSHHVSAYGR